MSKYSISNKQLLLPIALLSTVIIALLGISVFVVAPNIQHSLAKEIKDELSKHSIPANITLSGRDVVLSGTVKNLETKKKATLIAEKVCGIRYVDNQLLTEKTENLALLSSNNSDETIAKGKHHKKETSTNINLSETTLDKTSNEEEKKVPQLAKTPIKKKAEISEPKTEDNATIPSTKTSDLKIASNKQLSSTPSHSKETAKPSTTIEPTTDKKTTKEKHSPQKHNSSGKTLNYETMLAAMNAYNQQKGRNPKANKTAKGKKIHTLQLQFKKNTDSVLTESHKELDKWVKHLKNNNSHIKITVAADNTKLAESRAQAIKKYLSSQGIEALRIKTSGESGKESIRLIEN